MNNLLYKLKKLMAGTQHLIVCKFPFPKERKLASILGHNPLFDPFPSSNPTHRKFSAELQGNRLRLSWRTPLSAPPKKCPPTPILYLKLLARIFSFHPSTASIPLFFEGQKKCFRARRACVTSASPGLKTSLAMATWSEFFSPPPSV